ncbi:hypothetical protein [Candidatus Spongiihabitans sp.]|uniref:hypothetical protein n=1 Tax=Candidatus Spongiihabitans sp. TaxID=3101308 RepID=UPI003C6ED79D
MHTDDHEKDQDKRDDRSIFGILGDDLRDMRDAIKDNFQTPDFAAGKIADKVVGRFNKPLGKIVQGAVIVSSMFKETEPHVMGVFSHLATKDAAANSPGTDKHNDNRYSPGDLTDPDNPDDVDTVKIFSTLPLVWII